jgi:hypothetical protein
MMLSVSDPPSLSGQDVKQRDENGCPDTLQHNDETQHE